MSNQIIQISLILSIKKIKTKSEDMKKYVQNDIVIT